MNTEESFDAMLGRIEALITGRGQIRNFEAAYRLARRATKCFAAEPAAWSQLALAANLTERHGVALKAQADAKKKCSAWTDTDEGNCERDHARYNIFRRRPVKAMQHIMAARKFHAGDVDRLALLDAVEGELWYMLRQYGMALKCFLDAIVKWETLVQHSQADPNVKPPRPQWRFNSDRRQLKTIIALRRVSRSEARELYASLAERMADYGSPDVAWRLRLVMTGRVGNWIDTRIEESPSIRRFLVKVAPLANRLLSSVR